MKKNYFMLHTLILLSFFTSVAQAADIESIEAFEVIEELSNLENEDIEMKNADKPATIESVVDLVDIYEQDEKAALYQIETILLENNSNIDLNISQLEEIFSFYEVTKDPNVRDIIKAITDEKPDFPFHLKLK